MNYRGEILEEGRRVERPRPLAGPTRVRAERTCRCTNPSVDPAAGVSPASRPYERRVLMLNHAGMNVLEPMAGVEPTLRSYQDRGLPLSDTGDKVPARGVAPPFLPCRGSGLLLTYAGGSGSGSGDLHAAAPAPQAGGSLSTLEPVEGAAGIAPALTGPQPVVQSCYTSPPKESWSACVVMLHGLPLIKRPVCF